MKKLWRCHVSQLSKTTVSATAAILLYRHTKNSNNIIGWANTAIEATSTEDQEQQERKSKTRPALDYSRASEVNEGRKGIELNLRQTPNTPAITNYVHTYIFEVFTFVKEDGCRSCIKKSCFATSVVEQIHCKLDFFTESDL